MSVMPASSMTPQQQQVLLQLKLSHEKAMDAGDRMGAAQISRQARMFMADPNRYSPPRRTGEKVEDFWRGAGKGMKEYWQGVTSPIEGVQPTPIPPGVSQPAAIGGEIFGSVIANPLNLGKGKTVQAAQAGYEGFTAPAENMNQRLGNAAQSILMSYALSGAGSLANRMFDINADNPKLKDALKYAKRNKLERPFVDDYSINPTTGLLGWLVDEPLFAGRYVQAPRITQLERHARKKADALEEVIGLDESVINRYASDYEKVENTYNKIWQKYPNILDDESMMVALDDVQAKMQNVMHLLPGKVKSKVEALVNTSPRSLQDWHEVRSLLREHSHKMSMNRTAGRRHLTSAVDALDTMMYGSLDDVGRKMLREADTLYAKTIPKYTKMKVLREAIDDGNSEGIIDMFTKAESRFDAERIWNSLDEDGQQTMKAVLHRRAVESATDPKGVFSPSAYGKFWDDFSRVADIPFGKRDVDDIKGMAALYSMATNAEGGGSNWLHARAVTNTLGAAGLGTVAAAAGAGMFAPLFASVGVTAGIMGLMRTRAGNRMLRRIGQAQNLAERSKATYQMMKVIARNPEISQEVGVDTEEIGAYINLIEKNPAAWESFIGSISPQGNK